MIYLLTAVGLQPGCSSTVHIYTQTIHRTAQNKQYIEQHKNFGRVRAVPRLCGFYPGICLTTEKKSPKNFSQGSRRVPAGMMKIRKHKYIVTCGRKYLLDKEASWKLFGGRNKEPWIIFISEKLCLL
jgi:hypothetical protein